jgi:uncharacterized protein YfaS (alpha-2-macroglobulin family)
MLASVRAGFAAALIAFAFVPALAADKAYHRDDLADAAIKLEAEIKKDAGAVAKPAAALRRDVEDALGRRDTRGGMQALTQLVAVQPGESGNWLRLSRAVLQILPKDEREKATLLERAATAAYVAYQRAGNSGEEAESLALLSRTFSQRTLWRPALDTLRLSLELREVAERRGQYEQMRAEYGFRILDYTVDSDAASPRACFQLSEELPGKRTDLSPFVALGGVDKPALTVADKQLCIEGLKHGERYAVTVRAGLPSSVKEALTKSASYNIYVRDRKPFVRFTGKAYVLPRTGQQGIPLVSVNTDKVNVRIFRTGDRNLLNTVLGRDFQRNLYRYELERMAEERAIQVWKGELSVESPLNADVTTAFPVEQAVGRLQPGVYAMVAEPPGPASEEDSGALATQWFIVSDLGLTAYSGNDGVHVFVQSLATTEPKTGLEVRLLARSNEVLATRTTDAAGAAHFEAGLARGEGGLSPAMVVAAEPEGDYAFLNLKAAAFDLSDRGVAGRPPAPGLDAFVYTERGVYRSGETVHVTSLLRDAQGAAATDVPLTLILERPDGVEYRRSVVLDSGLGGRAWSVPIVSSAPTGTWKVRAHVDPKGPAAGQTTFMVEDYVPDRLEFELSSPTGRISKTQPAEVVLQGRYLYGAPASGLDLNGDVTVTPAKERPGLAGYQFGLADEEAVGSERQELQDLPDTDADGKARFTVDVEKLPASTRPLEAQVTVRLSEPGGRAVERSLTLPIVPNAPMIGIKPLFAGASLGDGDTATFDVAMISPDGRMLDRKGLRYELVRIETRYQWYRHSGSWDYEPVKSTRRTADGRVDAAPDKPGRIAVPVSWGRYRLEVSTDDPTGPVSSVTFDAGSYAEASADTPDLLEIALDKPEYRPGDAMTVAVTARTAGKVTLSVMGDRLISTTTAQVPEGTARLPLVVGRDWGTGAYVIATLHRPLDAQARRMPGRAIGVKWFAIDRNAKTLALDMKLPDLLRPNSQLRIPVKLDGLTPGEDARVVIAAVDVGILNLTNYKPPAPDDYYLGQRRLSAEIRDLYGQLIDGMQGTRGQIRSGGDAAGAISGSPPTQPPLALYSGVVAVDRDGAAEVTFDIPAFAGTVRVMAVAWSKDKVGHASGDVTVRDPVVLTATLPRFLLTGDRGGVRLDLDNVEGAAGDYRVEVTTHGPLAAGASQVVRLAAKERSGITLPLTAAGVGTGTVAVRVTGPGGFDLARSYALAAKPATQILTRRTVKPLAKGESLTVSSDLFADLVPGTGGVAVSVGASTALDVAALLQALDRYPFGCSEQIASRALPLLYVNDLAAEAHLALDTAVDQRIRDAIERLLGRQGSNGSFGLWSTGGDDAWLDSYVTDFLTRARERGFTVPDVAFKLAVDRLRNFVGNAPDAAKDGGRELSYALYVLARNGVAPIGDLRYLADTKLGDVATPIAKAQIAAALALLGDRPRAERVYAAALAAIAPQPKLEWGRTDYGSSLRDAAALVTLASEGGAPRPTVLGAVQRIEAARALTAYTSTQEQAWMVLAARALGKSSAVSLEAEGEARLGSYYRRVRADDLARAPLKVANTGEAEVSAVVSVTGAPIVPEPAAERGFKIERRYYTLAGDPADPSKAKQNQRFAVVLKMTEPQPQFARVIVADYLPAGFEIDNPRLVSSGDAGKLEWIEDAADPVHSEFRDDRFTAAFERKSGDPAVFTVAYVVRAVSPGRYVLPQAYVEDMYRPDRFGRTGTGTVEVEPAR